MLKKNKKNKRIAIKDFGLKSNFVSGLNLFYIGS